LTSFKDVDDAHAKKIFVNLSYMYAGLTFVFCLIFGKMSDKLSPKILVPVGFTLRGIALLCLQFVNSPVGYPNYFAWAFENMANLLAEVSLITYFRKIAPAEIRGILFAC
jgi:predicted MFS family arabinose efflux permease